MTLENASSACSRLPYRSYSIPIPYQSFGSYEVPTYETRLAIKQSGELTCGFFIK